MSDGRIERRKISLSETKGRISLAADGTLWPGEIQSGRAAGGATGGSDADLVAQFPGKVRKILVQTGAIVQMGDPLVLVEAMKMEFAVKAPYSGTVTQIRVKEGQQLSPGDRFVEMKPNG